MDRGKGIPKIENLVINIHKRGWDEIQYYFHRSQGIPESGVTKCVYFQYNKKRSGTREGKCLDKTMMSKKTNERLK